MSIHRRDELLLDWGKKKPKKQRLVRVCLLVALETMTMLLEAMMELEACLHDIWSVSIFSTLHIYIFILLCLFIWLLLMRRI